MVVFAAVAVLAAFLLSSAALGAAAAVLAGVALWNLIRVGEEPANRTQQATPEEKAAVAQPSTPTAEPIRPVPRIPPTLDPEVVLKALSDAVAGVASPVAAHLWLADEASATLRLVSAIGEFPSTSQPVPFDSSDAVAVACREWRAELMPRTAAAGRGAELAVWRFALPLSAGEARGVAAVDLRATTVPEPDALPSATAPLRGALAGALALQIARAELDTAQGLVEVARDLSRILDPDEVLSTALARAMELTDAATGSVMLLDSESGRLVIVVSRGLPIDVTRDTSLAEGEGIAGWVLASRQPLLIEDLPAKSTAARRHGIRSAVSVPIGDDDGVLGVLNVGSRSFPARFTESHLSAVEMLGRQTATALRNARAVSESREIYFGTLKALALALETKDPYSCGGTERVLECAAALGDVFALTNEEREALRIAALLHDMGMASVGEGILSADRRLTTVEQALLKMHPHIAAEMLAQAPALRHVVPIVYHHHEWYNGEGYVGGLAGEQIPLGARILAVADAYVAITSDRPYRPAMPPREALKELADNAGTQFDPDVVEALRDLLNVEAETMLCWIEGRA